MNTDAWLWKCQRASELAHSIRVLQRLEERDRRERVCSRELPIDYSTSDGLYVAELQVRVGLRQAQEEISAACNDWFIPLRGPVCISCEGKGHHEHRIGGAFWIDRCSMCRGDGRDWRFPEDDEARQARDEREEARWREEEAA